MHPVACLSSSLSQLILLFVTFSLKRFALPDLATLDFGFFSLCSKICRVSSTQTRWGVLFPAGVTSHTAGVAGSPHYTRTFFSSLLPGLTPRPTHTQLNLRCTFSAVWDVLVHIPGSRDGKQGKFIQGLKCPPLLLQKQLFFFLNSQLFLPVCELKSRCHQPCK